MKASVLVQCISINPFRQIILLRENRVQVCLTAYLNNDQYDIAGSFVIGDRITDVQLAKNLGCKAIWLKQDVHLGGKEIQDRVSELERVVAIETLHWSAIYSFLKIGFARSGP